MINEIYAQRIIQCFAISTIILLVFACSEQPNQQTEEAQPLADQVTEQVTETQQETMVKNDEAKADLIEAMEEARIVLKESEKLLYNAPAGKDSDAPLEALERELQTAEGLLSEVRRTIDQGDYLKARGQIHEITEKTKHVNQQIKQAIRKFNRDG